MLVPKDTGCLLCNGRDINIKYKSIKQEHLNTMNIKTEPYQHQITVTTLPGDTETYRDSLILKNKEKFKYFSRKASII